MIDNKLVTIINYPTTAVSSAPTNFNDNNDYTSVIEPQTTANFYSIQTQSSLLLTPPPNTTATTTANTLYNMIEMQQQHQPQQQHQSPLTQILNSNKIHHPYQQPECCAGCNGIISDRYYLVLMNRSWHLNCLRCSECKSCLESQMSCFTKDGYIYCKDDYIRRFPRKCQGCSMSLAPSDFVMKSLNSVYHRHCFKCIVCDKQLLTGDEYGSINGMIHCRAHYIKNLNDLDQIKIEPQQQQHQQQSNYTPFSPTSIFNLDQQQSIVYYQFDGNGNTLYPCNMPPTPNYSPPSSSSSSSTTTATATTATTTTTNGRKQQVSHDGTVTTTTTTAEKTSKGRPKKRKLLNMDQQQEKQQFNNPQSPSNTIVTKIKRQNSIDDSSSPDYKDLTNRLDYFSDENSGTQGDLLEHGCKTGGIVYDSSMSAAAAAAAAAQRQKRMRTSFKHHQLRVMKSYFELNHNPDAKDLKQLSQKTGLSKRVLQVWFQNARAKYRRNQSNCDQNSNQPLTSNGTGQLQSGGTTPSSPNQHLQGSNSLILQHLTTNTNELMAMDEFGRHLGHVPSSSLSHHHHHMYHQNSTTDTSSLNDLDLIDDGDVVDDDDEDDDNDDDDATTGGGGGCAVVGDEDDLNNGDLDDVIDDFNHHNDENNNQKTESYTKTHQTKLKHHLNHNNNNHHHHHHHHHRLQNEDLLLH